jgi:hypothetical protein
MGQADSARRQPQLGRTPGPSSRLLARLDPRAVRLQVKPLLH